MAAIETAVRQDTSAATPLEDRKSADERKASLARTVSNLLAQGRRVESQSDYQAVLARGKRTSHGLHLFLTIITAGLWGFVWIGMVFVNRDRREIVNIDEWGNVSVAKV